MLVKTGEIGGVLELSTSSKYGSSVLSVAAVNISLLAVLSQAVFPSEKPKPFL